MTLWKLKASRWIFLNNYVVFERLEILVMADIQDGQQYGWSKMAVKDLHPNEKFEFLAVFQC